MKILSSFQQKTLWRFIVQISKCFRDTFELICTLSDVSQIFYLFIPFVFLAFQFLYGDILNELLFSGFNLDVQSGDGCFFSFFNFVNQFSKPVFDVFQLFILLLFKTVINIAYHNLLIQIIFFLLEFVEYFQSLFSIVSEFVEELIAIFNSVSSVLSKQGTTCTY